MKESDLTAIEVRADAATPGDAEIVRSDMSGGEIIYQAQLSGPPGTILCSSSDLDNPRAKADMAAFIAFRREYPALVSEVRRLRKALTDLAGYHRQVMSGRVPDEWLDAFDAAIDAALNGGIE